VGVSLIVGVPLLSLILLRMLWSGSGLWFLLAGLALIAGAGLIFFNRRPRNLEFDRNLFAGEQARVPMIMAGAGVVFLTMLLVPNFAGGGDSDGDSASPSEVLDESAAPVDDGSQVVDEAAPPDSQPEVSNDAPPASSASGPLDPSNLPEGYQVHVVANGDTLWGISERYSTTVDAIVSANNLANPEDLQLDQELIIPPADASAAAAP
jgi:LysM repeat protein